MNELGTRWYEVLDLRPPPKNNSKKKRQKAGSEYELDVGDAPHTIADVKKAYKDECTKYRLRFVEPPETPN